MNEINSPQAVAYIKELLEKQMKVALMLLVIFLLWWYWYQGMKEDARYLEAKIKDTASVEDKLKRIEKVSDELKSNKLLYERISKGFNESKSKELFLLGLKSAAKQVHSSRTLKISNGGDYPLAEGFIQEIVLIAVEGSYSQLLAYFEELKNIPAIFGLKQWSFTNTDTSSADPLIKVELSLILVQPAN